MTWFHVESINYPSTEGTPLHCCCSRSNSHYQVRGHRTGSSHSGAEEYPREKAQTSQRWYTHNISQLTQFTPPPETSKSEVGSQHTMCHVHTGAYVSLLAPGQTDYRYTACHPRKTTTYNLLLRIRTTDASQLEKRNKEKRK